MAAFVAFLFVLSLFHAGYGQVSIFNLERNVPYLEINSCQPTSTGTARYFDSVTLKCVSCGQNSTFQRKSDDGLSCECNPGYRYTQDFGGKLVKCAKCPVAVSDDGWECVTCPNTVNADTKKCDSCPSTEINVFRLLNGNYAAGSAAEQCDTCSGDTQTNANFDRCERCSATISIKNVSSCTCSSTEEKLKGICFAKQNIKDSASMRLIPIDGSASVPSYYLANNSAADYILCNQHKNTTACQSLANMCVLLLYNPGSSRLPPDQPCSLFAPLFGNDFTNIRPEIQIIGTAENELERDDLTIEWTVDPVMTFPFIVGQWSLEGIFEGYNDITGGFIQLCEDDESILNAAYEFGTYYSHSCSISAINLWNEVKYPLKFYEIFLRYTASDDVENIFRIPLKIQNQVDAAGTLINQKESREWQLTRRFFLVDNLSTKPTADDVATYARYLEKVHLRVTLQDDTADGLIYIPYFELTYGQVSREQADAGAKVDISFKVSYTMSQGSYNKDFQIATGVLSSLSLLYAGYRTYVWNKRAGRLTIDFPTLVNFMFFVCGHLSNAFFVITYGISFYFFIFFKRQNVVYLVPLEGQPLNEWFALVISGFVLKALSLIHMVVMQCSADMFLVDWERGKGNQKAGGGDTKKSNTSGVSIWRTYFVANEWNEIQTKRKISRVFQIFAVLFFLHVVGFEDTTTKDPNGTVGKSDDVYQSEQSEMFRFALACTVYLLVAVVQVIFFVFIYERFISDDIREFVDLCSMSNVSVFVMAHAEFGYYIHGRSVHGRSDVDMNEMCNMIKREEDNLVGMRGLQPNTESQTFIMCLPKRLRQKYETVYMPVQLESASAANRGPQGSSGMKEKSIEAYNVLNRFLCAFIDHSLKDVDYVVKDKNFLEKVLDTEFLELTDKGIFYSDNGHSFDNVLFYGNELTLIIFDTFLFCIIDLIAQDFVLSGIITYVIIELICLAREMGGKKNLAKKTLVDERFLI